MWEFFTGFLFGSELILWIFSLGINGKKIKNRFKKITGKFPKEKIKFIEPVDLKKKWIQSDNLKDILK